MLRRFSVISEDDVWCLMTHDHELGLVVPEKKSPSHIKDILAY
jgi:hypothetical protein